MGQSKIGKLSGSHRGEHHQQQQQPSHHQHPQQPHPHNTVVVDRSQMNRVARGDSITLHQITDAEEDSELPAALQLTTTGQGVARDALSYKSNRPTGAKVFERDELAEVRAQLAKKDLVMYERIGTGSFAEVYRGAYHTLNKNVAIKVIDLKKTSAHYRTTLLPQELAIMKQMKHGRIIRVYNFSQVDNKVVMVMEYAARGTMSDLICQVGALQECAAWSLFTQVFTGLEYMHAKSIAHRDLKLENLLLNHQNVPKLADFSFAVYFDGVTLCTNFCGSVPYFAPELLGQRPYNPLVSDVWSMAVCLYIMTNDTFPFLFKEDRDMLAAQLAGGWRFRSRTERDFSDHYKHLVRAMLEPNVASRIRTAAVTKHLWVTTEQRP